MKTGIELIAEERQRQIEVEGFTADRDANYINGELALAASCYAAADLYRPINEFDEHPFPILFPFSRDWWKPTPDDRIRELQKAGALIAAEIDRLQMQTKEEKLKCIFCNEEKEDVRYRNDPYTSELYGDEDTYLICDDCAYERAMDV